MIPVQQTKVVVRNSNNDIVVNGNCYAACMASLLEVPIEAIPNVEVFFHIPEGAPDCGFWQTVMLTYLRSKGYEYRVAGEFKVFHGVDESRLPIDITKDSLRDKYYLVSGLSKRGVYHICIYKNGELIHDPHPTKEGIETEEEFSVLEPMPAEETEINTNQS